MADPQIILGACGLGLAVLVAGVATTKNFVRKDFCDMRSSDMCEKLDLVIKLLGGKRKEEEDNDASDDTGSE